MTVPEGFVVRDPDVVFTDVALALLGAWLAWRLRAAPNPGRMTRAGVVVMTALASAAFWGAVFHAFFARGTSTPPGFAAWVPVVLSILVVASTLLDLALDVSVPRLPPRARYAIVGTYAALFATVALLVDTSFGTIVRFYAPVVLLFLVVAGRKAAQGREAGWTLIAVSFAITVLAAGLQQARVSLHEHFDHNAVFHVLQGAALVLLYRGFSRAGTGPAAASS